MTENTEDHPDSPQLLRATVLSGLCSVVPVPFLDDFLLRCTRKGLVLRIYEMNGVAPLSKDVQRILYDGSKQGCLAAGVGLIFSVVKKIIKKAFKTVFFFLAVRSAALDMAETFLLGRTLDRCLKRGLLTGAKVDAQEVHQVRAAFKEAMSSSEQRVFAAAMKRVWKSLKGRRDLVRRLASLAKRWRRNGREVAMEASELPQDMQNSIDKESRSLSSELESSQVQEFLARFDEHFDSALGDTV